MKGQDLRYTLLRHQPALIELEHSIRESFNFLGAMGSQQQCTSTSSQLGGNAQEVGLAFPVQAGGRLVQQQHRRIGKEHRRQRQSLLHAPGKGSSSLTRVGFQADLPKH